MGRCVFFTLGLWLAVNTAADTPIQTPRIIERHPHNDRIFTQGLALENGRLYHSSGLREQSQVIATDLASGALLARYRFADRYFAEGLALVDDEVMVLTWQAGLLFVLDKNTLKLKRKLKYEGEGWGLAYDGQQLWLSDGSSRIRRYDPATMKMNGRIEVHDEYGPVRRINELEWVQGKLLANIWHSTRLIAIDPASGAVVDQWELDALVPDQRYYGRDSVANGIAYDSPGPHIWLTGKGWPVLYQLELPGLHGE